MASTSVPLDLTLKPQSPPPAFGFPDSAPSWLSSASNLSLWTAPSWTPASPSQALTQISRPGSRCLQPQLVPGTWQVHVDQQGLGGAALSRRRQELGGGRWGEWERGIASGFELRGTDPPEATEVTGRRRWVQQGRAGGAARVWRGMWGGGGVLERRSQLPGCSKPSAPQRRPEGRNFRFN